MQRDQLARWQSDLQAYRTTSPLRKFTRREHLVRELSSGDIKVVFFLRASDHTSFAADHQLAVELAKRFRKFPVCYSPSPVVKGRGGGSSGTVVNPVATHNDDTISSKCWVPSFRVDVFWVDAGEQLALTSQLGIKMVPSVIFFTPMKTAEMGVTRDDTDEGDIVQGAHILNRMDLNLHDTIVLHNRGELTPAFPTTVDDLLRVMAGPRFHDLLQVRPNPISLKTLYWDDNSGSDGGDLQNQRYLRLNYRYQAASEENEEEEEEAFRLLNDFLSVETDEIEQSEGDTGVVAEQKAEDVDFWKEQLEKRKQAKAERVRQKAARTSDARQQAVKEFKTNVLREVSEGLRQDTLVVTRHAMRRTDLPPRNPLIAFRQWEKEAPLMAAEMIYDVVEDGTVLGTQAYYGLEREADAE
ncbi:unnamed protein product [Phytomonas sp. Hart1]|nr:unnamed protein product [Phytomonas sp. Hart1]|eukprot:CCW69690.1 unnamed protein product [Phytomonas sp. isolate Hart1]